MSYPDHMNATERRIIDVVVKGALAQGFAITVYGEGEPDLIKSVSYDEITTEIAATGLTELMLYPDKHWFQFVHGNGTDVFSDLTVKSEDLAFVKEAQTLAERLSQ